ncbi:MAG: class I SAM-dependent methyltransferase [Polyangiales bacterium]
MYSYDPGPHFREFLASESATVQGFDDMSESYEHLVHEFSDELWKAAEPTLHKYIPKNGRVLDPSAGPGREAIRLARWLTGGEVVAADLSRNMVERALHNAEVAGVENMAFHQLNAERLRAVFSRGAARKGEPESAGVDPMTAGFDAIVSSLAFHHYQRERVVARSFADVLRPGGIAFIIDGGPEWFQKLARPISVLADPGFVRHHSGDDFKKIFESLKNEDGARIFPRVAYTQILPGFYLVTAQKALVELPPAKPPSGFMPEDGSG